MNGWWKTLKPSFPSCSISQVVHVFIGTADSNTLVKQIFFLMSYIPVTSHFPHSRAVATSTGQTGTNKQPNSSDRPMANTVDTAFPLALLASATNVVAPPTHPHPRMLKPSGQPVGINQSRRAYLKSLIARREKARKQMSPTCQCVNSAIDFIDVPFTLSAH